MHILNHFVTAQCFVLLLFYPHAERVIWMHSGNSDLAYYKTLIFLVNFIYYKCTYIKCKTRHVPEDFTCI